MNKKTIKAMAGVLAAMMVLAGCGVQEASVEEATTEETVAEASTETEETVEAEPEKTEEVAEEPEVDDFNDFVEASFEPVSYPAPTDENPDYTGIYCNGYETEYEYCKLIKQEDGTYYCNAYSYRVLFMECKATYKSEGLLEIQDDEYAGTIAIDGYNVTVNVSYNGGEEEEYTYTTHKYNFPDMDQYTGVYTYTRINGEVATITVGYNENRDPIITVEDGGKTYTFDHMPSNTGIWNFDDEIYGPMLYSDREDKVVVPDDRVFSTYMDRDGDTYIAIKQEGNKSLVYFKHFEPVVLH